MMAEFVTVKDITLSLAETKRGIYLAPERRKLASGRMSCFYLNVGDEVISYPSAKHNIVLALHQTYLRAYNAAVVGTDVADDRMLPVPEGANMLASSLGDSLQIGQLRVRENLGDHGDQRAIEGYFEPGMSVAIIEDVMSTGGSTINRAIEPARAAGLIPTTVIALVDRQYGGIPKMRELGFRAEAFTTTTEIAQVLIDESLVSDQQIRLLKEELEELKAV